MIVDASVLLCAFFPDEAQPQAQRLVREHVAGREKLIAPALLPYELSNAVWQAERRGRVSRSQADEILQAYAGLEIEIVPQTGSLRDCFESEMLPLARRFNCSVYDATYLALAEARKEALITADERLYNAIRDHLERVIWIGNYPLDEKTE
jgi:predicted nucleic acid-binding protein